MARCSEITDGTVTVRQGSTFTAQYSVNGKSYKVTGMVSEPKITIEALYVEPITAGDTVEVHYNPKFPIDSYVGDEPMSRSIVIIGALLVLFSCSGGICFRAWFRRRHDT